MKRMFTLCIAFLIVVAACAPTRSAGGPGVTTATPSPKVDKPTRGGTLVFAMWQEPTTLAPMYINQTIGALVAQVAVEPLAETDNDGNYVPVLARQIPTIANGKARVVGTKLEVEWELKPGITWSDGKPLTSADIHFTWQTWIKDPKVVNRAGFSEIEAIETPSPTTALVKYKTVYAPYPTNFNWILPKHLLENEADISRSEYNRRPLGTGPFRITEFKAGESITAERNPNYRDKDKPYLDRIVFKSVPTSEVAIAQLKAGEVQAMWNLLESQTPDVEREANISVIIAPGPTVERIELNTAENKDGSAPDSVHPVLGDIAVRKALLWATPKAELAKRLFFDKARPAESGYPQGWGRYTGKQDGYDPKKASDALDSAGWVKGADGIRSKGGVRASLTFITTTGNKTREQVQQVLGDEWKKIGIETKIQNMPSAVFLSGSAERGDPRKKGTYDLNMYATGAGVDPHAHIFPRFHSTQIPHPGNRFAGLNYTRLKSPEADRALAEAGATLDQAARAAAYNRAVKAINDQYVVIWLYDRARIDAHRRNVGGMKASVWGNVTWNVQDWFIRQP